MVLLYDRDVERLGTMRIAEHFTVVNGKIAHIRQIHDTAALRAAGFATSGGEVRFGFAGLEEYIIMRVAKSKRPSSVYWNCVIHTSLPEWKATQPRFDLVEETPGPCRLDFRHIGLTPQLECFDDCRPGWIIFLQAWRRMWNRVWGCPMAPDYLRRIFMKNTVKKKPRKLDSIEPDPNFAPVAKAFAKDRNVTAGMMMASYGLKVKGKIFAMLVRGHLVVKLPRHRVDEMVEGGKGERFDPGHGKLMKEWAVVLTEKKSWVTIAKEAYRFVKSETL